VYVHIYNIHIAYLKRGKSGLHPFLFFVSFFKVKMDCTCYLFAYESSYFFGFLFTPIKACYETARVKGGEHSLGDHYEAALVTIAMAAAVPRPIAKAPFHNTHGTFFFSLFSCFFWYSPLPFEPPGPFIHGGQNHCCFTTLGFHCPSFI